LRNTTAIVGLWSYLWLAAACSERVVVIEQLWQGEIVNPNFGGGVGDGAGARFADATVDDGAANDIVFDAAGDSGKSDAVLDDSGAKGDSAANIDGGDSATNHDSGDIVDSGDSGKTDINSDVVVADAIVDGGDATVDDAKPAPVTFKQLWNDVFKPWGCTSPACHGPATAVPIFIDVVSSKWSLINQQAVGPCAPALLVVPNSPAKSLLLQKIDPALESCGLKMPSANGVDADSALLVRTWIEQGAP
jgi:hypothetical protein